MYLEIDAAENGAKTEKSDDLAGSVMEVVKVKCKMEELHNQRHSSYCENTYCATEHDMGDESPTPPVNKITSSVNLHNAQEGPCEPHDVAVDFWQIDPLLISIKRASALIWECNGKSHFSVSSMICESESVA